MFIIAAMVFGCTGAKSTIKTKSISDKKDVFTEIQTENVPPKDFTDLIIKVRLKTCCEDFYLLGSGDSGAGKPKYPFMFNIDGQAVKWEADGKYEDTPEYDNNRVRIPDGGEGVRYYLEKRIRLRAGTHNLFFALPSRSYLTEFVLMLKDGTQNTLEFEPIYTRNRGFSRNFFKGLSHYNVFLNGNPLFSE